MKRWNELDTKFRAAFLTVFFCLLGACILVAISMTFNWTLHKKTVEEFMAEEDIRVESVIEARIAECRARTELLVRMEQESQLQRIGLVLEAKDQLGEDWKDPEIRSFVMYGRPPDEW